LKSLNMMKRVKVNPHKEIEDYDERFREILMIMGDDDVWFWTAGGDDIPDICTWWGSGPE